MLSFMFYIFIGYYGHALQKVSWSMKFVWLHLARHRLLFDCRVLAVGLARPQDSDGEMAPVAMDVEGGSSMGMRDAPRHTHTRAHSHYFLPSFLSDLLA